MPGKPIVIDIQRLLELKAQGLNQTEIGRALGVSQAHISNVSRACGIKWYTGAAGRDQTGSKNPNYIDGLSKSSVERVTRRVVLEAGRDLRLCERCGRINKWQEHHRHHKDRDRSNNTAGNLEVLCTACHSEEHINEQYRDDYGRFV